MNPEWMFGAIIDEPRNLITLTRSPEFPPGVEVPFDGPGAVELDPVNADNFFAEHDEDVPAHPLHPKVRKIRRGKFCFYRKHIARQHKFRRRRDDLGGEEVGKPDCGIPHLPLALNRDNVMKRRVAPVHRSRGRKNQ